MNWTLPISAISSYITPFKRGIKDFLVANKHWIFVIISAYCVADLLVISLRSHLLSAHTAVRSQLAPPKSHRSLTDYLLTGNSNIFHVGNIPPSLSSLQNKQWAGNSQPRLSTLPLTLNGTIVYRNPIHSVANIRLKRQNKSETYQTKDKVESLAIITEITRDRVYLINLTNNKKEYLEIPDLSSLGLQFRVPPSRGATGKKGILLPKNKNIKQLKPFNYQVNRSLINQRLRSLPDVLQQAKVVPHWEKGKLVGYRFKHIQPGSPYEDLGFKVADVIKSVEGEALRSELQAVELFHRLKNSSQLDMVIQRKGQDIPFSWTVNEDTSIEDSSDIRFK